MTTPYIRAASESPAPSLHGGASGYFSPPSSTLDPHLFDGSAMRLDVRTWLWQTLSHALETFHLSGVNHWLHAWVAGSGITYQWAADRGNGDLDVLFGVDYPTLLRYNPEFRGVSEDQFAMLLDDWLRSNVWPNTSAVNFHGQTYEVTFYINPGTETDIHRIHPYAALDIRSGEWVVRPPKVQPDPEAMYPREWFAAAQRDVDTTKYLIRRFDVLGHGRDKSEAAVRNREVQLRKLTEQAGALLDEIHIGRREAFGPQGNGYGDWHNFRWQYGKKTGIINALRAIVKAGAKAKNEEDTALYGAPIASADTLLARTALYRRPA